MTVVNGLAAAGRRSAGRVFLVCAAALTLLFGVWVSVHYAYGVWKPDPDDYVLVGLWRGFQQYGFAFFPSWNYTQDNWLFSLVPISSLLFKLFGVRTQVVMLTGWLSFATSVGLTAWLANRLAGPRAALALACTLLFGGVYALGQAGYLGYPISHNISMSWALAALILAVLALERGSLGLALVSSASVFVNVVSDPWAGVGIAVPLILASGAVGALNRRSRLGAAALVLSLGSLAALVAARTRLFGLLSFLPPSHFKIASFPEMLSNAYWAYRSLGAIFNIVPGASLESHAGRLISVAALVIVLGAALTQAALKLRREPPVRQLIVGVSILSIAAVAALFVVGRWPDLNIGVGRFLPNVYFLGALLIAGVAGERWASWPRAERAGLAVYAALFALSGVVSAPGLWTGGAWDGDRKSDEAVALGEFLSGRGLAYGYGPFWGSQALTMDTVTEGRVTIRPVTFNGGRVRRRPAETSSFWYRPGAEPKANRPFVLVRNDGEECGDVNACVEAVRRQFGEPVEQLAWRDFTVLVYPREIAGGIDP